MTFLPVNAVELTGWDQFASSTREREYILVHVKKKSFVIFMLSFQVGTIIPTVDDYYWIADRWHWIRLMPFSLLYSRLFIYQINRFLKYLFAKLIFWSFQQMLKAGREMVWPIRKFHHLNRLHLFISLVSVWLQIILFSQLIQPQN